MAKDAPAKDPTVALTQAQMAAVGLSEEEQAALAEEDETGDGVKIETAAKAEGTEEKPEAKTGDQSDGGTPDPKAAASEVPQASDADATGGGAADLTDEEKAAAAEAATAEAATAEAATAEAAAAKAKEEEDATPFVDSFRQQMAARGNVEEIDAKLATNNEAIQALDAKLDEGDVAYAEHSKANRVLMAEQTELLSDKREAEFVSANNEMSSQQHWEWEVERFVEENAEFKNPVIYGALRGALEDLYAEPDNSGRAYRWFLNQASKQVNEAFNIKPGVVATDAGTPEGKSDAAQAKQLEKAIEAAAPADPPPKTLAETPAAEENTTNSDPFAKLDEMEGMELEAAVASMSDQDAKRYLDTRSYA